MLRLRIPLPRLVSAGEVIAGPGSVGALRALDSARALLVVSSSLARDSILLGKVQAAVGSLVTTVAVAPAGEPSLSSLGPLIASANASAPDWIIAVGGGSVLDAAKLAWVLYEHPTSDLERLARPFALPPLRGKCRFAALPTTAGTGSEVSSSALLVGENGRKIAIVSHELLPDLAILDPQLTVGVPADAVASAGLDALAHALEGYVSRFNNPLLDPMAEIAARTLLAELPRSWSNPTDLECRQNVMQAALYAGWVQNLKVPGVGHAIAHQLAHFGIAHGAACGALLLPALRYNCRDARVRSKLERLARSVGCAGVEAFLDRVRDLRIAMDAEKSWANRLASKRGDITGQSEGVIAGALEDICARANPRTLDHDGVAEVLEEGLK